MTELSPTAPGKDAKKIQAVFDNLKVRHMVLPALNMFCQHVYLWMCVTPAADLYD